MSKQPPVKSKKLGIIGQVAIYFIIALFVVGVVIYFIQTLLSNQQVSSQTESYADNLAAEVENAMLEYPAIEWLMDYWYNHSAELDIEYDVDFYEINETAKKARDLTARNPDLEIRYAREEDLEALSEEDQKLYAEITYSWLLTRVNQIKLSYDVNYLFCVISEAPYDHQFFVFSGYNHGMKRGTGYEDAYILGVEVDVSEAQQEGMQAARDFESHLADAGDYVDYYSFSGIYGDHTVFLGMTYSQKELKDSMAKLTLSESLFSVANAAVMAALCMLVLYILVLKPLGKVSANIHLYKNTKDSSTVRDNLKDVRPNNEIGTLSGDIVDLTREMDDYMVNLQTVTAEKERLDTELSLGSTIQASMLPGEFPAFPERSEFNIYASMDPAKEVGGDFYDFFLIDDDHLYMTIADVSGKGIPGALFMMMTKIILANNTMSGKSVSQIMHDTNMAVCANNKADMFVTVWVGILEISTGKLTCANAGHEYPVLKKPDGQYELLKDTHGFVIGGIPEMQYKEYEIQLEPGTKIFVYTDGVPEATNGLNEQFGPERMLEALNGEPDAEPEKILENVRAAIDGFVKDAEQFDDLTMICFEYKGTGEQEVK